ncbi:MAG TPA: hypothetical protein EYQ26_02035 [Rhodospirillales bacterium]|nr:hypothetical protein [Rhodospirillales bacterium]
MNRELSIAQCPLLGDRRYDRHFTADDYQPVLWAGTQGRNVDGNFKSWPPVIATSVKVEA